MWSNTDRRGFTYVKGAYYSNTCSSKLNDPDDNLLTFLKTVNQCLSKNQGEIKLIWVDVLSLVTYWIYFYVYAYICIWNNFRPFRKIWMEIFDSSDNIKKMWTPTKETNVDNMTYKDTIQYLYHRGAFTIHVCAKVWKSSDPYVT